MPSHSVPTTLPRPLPAPPRHPSGRVSVVGWLEALLAHGYSSFSTEEAQRVLGGSLEHSQVAMSRQIAKGRLIRPVTGLYVIVPPEHRLMGAPPPLWYIDAAMRHLGIPYYVGLLSAAALHGASQQAPQELQVLCTTQRRARTLGRGRIRWVTKTDVGTSAVQPMVTQTGTVTVSTPETTAADLVRFPRHSGYLDNIATVLSDVGGQLNPVRLAAAVRGDRATAQRLGYLLSLVGYRETAGAFHQQLESQATRIYPLDPSQPVHGEPIDPQWNIRINAAVDPD